MTDAHGESEFDAQRFVDKLTGEEKMLVVLKQELYQGCWQEMITDLQARLAGRPYIFKLANRIEDDLKRIECLQAFEDKTGLDLGDFVKLETVNRG